MVPRQALLGVGLATLLLVIALGGDGAGPARDALVARRASYGLALVVALLLVVLARRARPEVVPA